MTENYDRDTRQAALSAAVRHTRTMAREYGWRPSLAELLDVADTLAAWIDTGERP